jgi:hypothetical protein
VTRGHGAGCIVADAPPVQRGSLPLVCAKLSAGVRRPGDSAGSSVTYAKVRWEPLRVSWQVKDRRSLRGVTERRGLPRRCAAFVRTHRSAYPATESWLGAKAGHRTLSVHSRLRAKTSNPSLHRTRYSGLRPPPGAGEL